MYMYVLAKNLQISQDKDGIIRVCTKPRVYSHLMVLH